MPKYLNLNYFSSQIFKPENLSSDNPIALKKSYAVIHKVQVEPFSRPADIRFGGG